jgi:hypothetical protein
MQCMCQEKLWGQVEKLWGQVEKLWGQVEKLWGQRVIIVKTVKNNFVTNEHTIIMPKFAKAIQRNVVQNVLKCFRRLMEDGDICVP